MQMVKQAVILAGGRGTRLMPLTADRPKPMVDVNGRPFLQYILDDLLSFGVERVLLLVGYKHQVIQDYFGSSYRNLAIEYSVGNDELDTAERVFKAWPLIEQDFWLLYSDNYIKFDFQYHLQQFMQDRTLRMLVAKKDIGNIALSGEQVTAYSTNRKSSDCRHVELGFMLVHKAFLEKHIHQQNKNFNECIISAISSNLIKATVSPRYYFSVSDVDRLQLMKLYLSTQKILLLDRDGVINQRAPKGEYIYKLEDFAFIPSTIEALTKLSQLGFKFIVISNQAGIGRHLYTKKQAEAIHEYLQATLAEKGIQVLDVLYCPHHWDEQCMCRKPKAGMFFELEKKYALRLEQCVYVGDDPRDCLAAKNANCFSAYIGDETELSASNVKSDITGQNLNEILPLIVEKYKPAGEISA